MKCAKCGNEIDKLDAFPGNYCLACHEKRYNATQDHGTAEDLANQFKNLIK